MKPVFEKLQPLEIDPTPERPISTPDNAPTTELTDRITRRAEQIWNEWNPKDSGEAAAT
jgi:hypothetical protein